MNRISLSLLILALCACGSSEPPAADNAGRPANNNAADNAETAEPARNDSTRRFELPEVVLPQPEEEPLYKLVARDYFDALRKMDVAGLRRTLSRRVQDLAGAGLKEDVDAMREVCSRIEIEEVSWTDKETHWICTFHQILHLKSGQTRNWSNQRIQLVRERGFWRVEELEPESSGNK